MNANNQHETNDFSYNGIHRMPLISDLASINKVGTSIVNLQVLNHCCTLSTSSVYHNSDKRENGIHQGGGS